MIKQLLNKLQGKTWGATCNMCYWSAGRQDLTKEQARQRANMHRINVHGGFGTSCRELTLFNKWTVILSF